MQNVPQGEDSFLRASRDATIKESSFIISRELWKDQLLFDESTLELSKDLLDKKGLSFTLAIQFETSGVPMDSNILDGFNLVIGATKSESSSEVSKLESLLAPVSLEDISQCFVRSYDTDTAIGYNQTFPADMSIQDSLQVLAPQADQNQTKRDKSRPFDSSLLSYLTVRVCENSTIPCDTDALSVADGSVIVIEETSSPPLSSGLLLRLKKTARKYADYWDIENYPMLGGKDLRFDFYVGDLFVGSTLFPVAEEEDNVQSPVEFAINSNPVIRAHVLRGKDYSAYTIATHLMCEFYATPEVVIGLLFEEGFPAVEVAKVMNLVYDVSSEDYQSYGDNIAETVPKAFITEGIMSCAFTFEKSGTIAPVTSLGQRYVHV